MTMLLEVQKYWEPASIFVPGTKSVTKPNTHRVM
uniref:Uncharacterized protein n=1 Tax=Wuchereria bancrofti TaxID=6293 RepID=A0AAF5Q178_WUCBA